MQIRFANRDGHIWIVCRHPYCTTGEGKNGKHEWRVPAGPESEAARGQILNEAIEHDFNLHGS